MGIPSFFRVIIQEYPDIHFWNEQLSIDHLFFDFNCLIYECVQQLQRIPLDTFDSPDKQLLDTICEYTQHIICDIVKPLKSVYIAIDGPAPVAKMVQQRSRRYKRMLEDQYKEPLHAAYKQKRTYNFEFDTTRLSPGTEFMTKMSEHIREFAKSGGFCKHLRTASARKGFSVSISDSNLPGEGEHKIMKRIKTFRKDTSTLDDRVSIYGLDADLIVLSIASRKNHIYILREPRYSDVEQEFYSDTEFLYIDIDKCKIGFLQQYLPNAPVRDAYRLLDDLVFLTFLCGNDFVRAPPFLQVKSGGMDTIMGLYTRSRRNTQDWLVDKRTAQINIRLLMRIFEELSRMEKVQLPKLDDRIQRCLAEDTVIVSKDNIRDREKNMTPLKIHLARWQHEEFFSRWYPEREKDGSREYFSEFRYADPEKWYSWLFHVPKVTDDIINDYLESLAFTFIYYYEGISGLSWHYAYYPHVPPLPSDVSEYLQNKYKDIYDNISMTEFLKFNLANNSKAPLTPYQQLCMIFPPPKLRELLPIKFAEDVLQNTPAEWYPEPDINSKETRLCRASGMKWIYCEPELKNIPLDHLIKVTTVAMKRGGLSERDTTRNTVKRCASKFVF